MTHPQFRDIECVTLDLDDTLWPVEPTINQAELELYNWIDQRYPRITSHYTQEQLANKRVTLVQARQDIAHDVTALRRHALKELADEFGCNNDFVEDAMSVFRHHRNQVVPYQHSESVLQNLKSHYVLGAITNGNAQLEKISLGRYFDFTITAEDVGVSKPHLKMFQSASLLAKIPLDKIVHVGDSPQTDVIGALNAGCKAIWLNQKRQAWPGGQTPNHVVHCISELPEILIANVSD